jgi:hypothetical protein
MNKGLLVLPLALLGLSEPARATGGFVCRTAGARPIEVSLGFGHVPGSPLILTRLLDNRRPVPVKSAQWWFDNDELRLVLIDPGALRREGVLRTRRNGHVYDGSLWRGGQRRWVRCRED